MSLSKGRVTLISNALTLNEAWNELSDAVRLNKAITFIDHQDLASVVRLWETIGLILKKSSGIIAAGSLLCATTVVNKPDLVKPLAVSGLVASGIYHGLWKSKMFYSYYPITSTMHDLIKSSMICNTGINRYILSRQTTDYCVSIETMFTCLALFVGFNDSAKAAVDKMKDWFDSVKDKFEVDDKIELTPPHAYSV